MDRSWIVRHVRDNEFSAWSDLFRGYCDFYQWPTSSEHQRQIWDWIHGTHVIEAIVAVEVDASQREIDVPRALGHLREWVRPLRGVLSGYLDDLYVDPLVRGAGAVDAMFAAMNQMAIERDWAVIRWTTAQDNLRAQGAYDKVAHRTTWVTYDMTPTPTGVVIDPTN